MVGGVLVVVMLLILVMMNMVIITMAMFLVHDGKAQLPWS